MSDISRKREHDNSSEEDIDEVRSVGLRKARLAKRPLYGKYLESIDVKKLDFDREKICSVTLSRSNVYCCLCDGKYVQGRNQNSAAFKHAIETDRHVFLSFDTLKVYVLPENYEVEVVPETLLADIVYSANPTFDFGDLGQFPRPCHDLNGRKYTNGFVGMNNLTPDGYSVVIIQAIAHVLPIRDYFLLDKKNENSNREGNKELSDLISLTVRKLWSCKLLRKSISPHELLNSIASLSQRRFTVDAVGDPKLFLLWVISTLCGSKREHHSLGEHIKSQFQGQIQVNTIDVHTVKNDELKTLKFSKNTTDAKVQRVNFWLLSLDLPETGVFNSHDSNDNALQVKLESLLQKYDGVSEHHTKGTIKTYKIRKHPRFMILHYNRFKQGFTALKDRNQTLVEFTDKMEFDGIEYELVCNITHECLVEGKLSDTEDLLTSRWKISVCDHKHDQWYELDDIEVNKVEKEFLFLKECYLQIWKRVTESDSLHDTIL